MRDLRSLEERVNNLIQSVKIDREALIHEWYLLAEMNYRTHGCYRKDGSVMSDEEYLAECEKGFPLENWIAEQTERRLRPFGRVDRKITEGIKHKGKSTMIYRIEVRES